MKLVLLDRSTLGEDVPLTMFEAFGELTVWQTSSPEEIPARVKDADVIHHSLGDPTKEIKPHELARYNRLCIEFDFRS